MKNDNLVQDDFTSMIVEMTDAEKAETAIITRNSYLKEKYQKLGIKDPKITVESYVTVNGTGSRLYINKYVDLTKVSDGFHHKWWLLPYDKK